jgi:Calreticulin family
LSLPPKPTIGKTTNLYTLVLQSVSPSHVRAPRINVPLSPNNTYDVLVNSDSLNRGSLLEDFNPPVNPPTEIDDPEDRKPEDWVDASRISDPDAKKPDDWDEDAPYEILDEDAEKPEGWLDDEPLTIPDPGAWFPVWCVLVPCLCASLRCREA